MSDIPSHRAAEAPPRPANSVVLVEEAAPSPAAATDVAPLALDDAAPSRPTTIARIPKSSKE